MQVGEPGMSGGQSAYNKAVGMPADAPTASDAPGFGASTGKVDVAMGGAAGAVDGPVPPTGQGGTLAGTGASAMQPSTVRLIAFTRIWWLASMQFDCILCDCVLHQGRGIGLGCVLLQRWSTASTRG